ncbi:Isochorismatase domain-containing protein 2 [Seminavis robusta]|uniref:Isochorismatase domain-containing protein 2 n=1 Tax=Seminavis robusta TaxID=568900 RepID=A0A9N8DJ31_9STRA|nr:Isochorismatase domain-containing protein 2 [Seminavis robusta]|eukprot:Sro180_g078660.1 Isochorismatase domain-containing protein 2 (244) ;mRNA; f:15627-16778
MSPEQEAPLAKRQRLEEEEEGEGQPSTTNNKTNDTMSAASTAARLVGKLKPESSILMVCDIQTKFRPLVWRGETVVKTAQYMTSVAKALGIPMVATQQYTKVFGPTVPEVFATPEDLQACPTFEKKLFSMLTDEVKAHVEPLQKKSFLLVGIEAHVCLQQTALDLLEQGKDVHVIVDGVSSQQPLDREIALQRMAAAGAYLTTAQSAAFMLMQSANHDNFKTVSKLTVEHMKLENEFNEALKK